MSHFQNLSIRYKLTLLLSAVVSIVLFAVSIAHVVGEVHATRASMEGKYTSLAKIVAAQSGAALSIADVDASGVRQILADLAVESSIQYAALFDADAREVAHYHPATPLPQRPPPPRALGAAFTADGFLDVLQEVTLSSGGVVGRLYLRASTVELQAQIQRALLIAVGVYVLALALSLLLSLALQRVFSAPILELVGLMQRVSREHNYDLRTNARGADELGALCTGFNSMLADIQRRDAELERSNGELLRSNDELRQFAFMASHDLQEPLRTITSYCHVLKEECQHQLSSDGEECIRHIVGGAERMKTLVTDVLNYSRVGRDEQTSLASVRMAEVVHEAIANLKQSIDDSGALVSFGPLPSVPGRHSQLVQVVQNLLANAILYRREEPPRIQIAAAARPDHWEFSIRDNGIGVDAKYQEQIFEIFRRLHGRGEYPGTGIGLAVCKKIVGRHGGRIWVESRLGEGSVFRFTIPSRTDQEAVHERERELAEAL